MKRGILFEILRYFIAGEFGGGTLKILKAMSTNHAMHGHEVCGATKLVHGLCDTFSVVG